MTSDQIALLVLEDGTIFRGNAIGKIGTTEGEIAFNTGMTGYQEVFTDPSYFGQILIMTAPHIGNYGTNSEEIESDGVKIAGLVTKKFSNGYSRPSGNKSLQDLMEENNTVGISDIDTRALVRHIRNRGAMNAVISSEIFDENILVEKAKQIPSMSGMELSSRVSTKNAYTIGDEAALAARISGIILGGGTTGGLVFATTDNGNLGERVRILNNGAVGIGTTSPSLISGYIGLNVVNAGYTQIKLQSNASAAGIEFKPSSGNSWELQANNSNQWFVFDRTQDVYRLTINVYGNGGIGTTSPAY